jgi:hypothetical protein
VFLIYLEFNAIIGSVSVVLVQSVNQCPPFPDGLAQPPAPLKRFVTRTMLFGRMPYEASVREPSESCMFPHVNQAPRAPSLVTIAWSSPTLACGEMDKA